MAEVMQSLAVCEIHPTAHRPVTQGVISPNPENVAASAPAAGYVR
jgi:hypothetical protein